MNENVRLLFDNLGDGLLIISSNDHRILYANSTARQLGKLDVGAPAPGWLNAQAAPIREGLLKLPFTFEISLHGVDAQNHRTRVTILNSPVATDYIVILSGATASSATQDDDSMIGDVAEMLECEFSNPMDNFLRAVDEMQAQLDDFPTEDWKVFSSVQSVHRSADALQESFSRIRLMAEVFRHDPIRANDRIAVSLLIDDVLRNTGKLLAARHVRVSFSGVSDNLPVAYGSKALLVQALSGYVRQLVKRVDSGAHILFSARTNGYFVLLSLNNFGRLAPTNKTARKLPYLSGKQAPDEEEQVQLSLPMCKRVIELSGGNLRIEQSDGLLTGITFELPIGSPANQEEEYILQAQRYAEDLANLMKQKGTQNVEV